MEIADSMLAACISALKTASVWWNKILDIDPLNEMAAKALATIKK